MRTTKRIAAAAWLISFGAIFGDTLFAPMLATAVILTLAIMVTPALVRFTEGKSDEQFRRQVQLWGTALCVTMLATLWLSGNWPK